MRCSAFVTFILASVVAVFGQLRTSQLPNTNNLASNQLFMVTAPGAVPTNMNIAWGQITQLIVNGQNLWTGPNTFSTSTNTFTKQIMVGESAGSGQNYFFNPTAFSNSVSIVDGQALRFFNTTNNKLFIQTIATPNDLSAIVFSDYDYNYKGIGLSPLAIFSTYSNSTIGVTSNYWRGLFVSNRVAFGGANADSNSVWTCTNATTGEGEWRTATTIVQSNGTAIGNVSTINFITGTNNVFALTNSGSGSINVGYNLAMLPELTNVNTISRFMFVPVQIYGGYTNTDTSFGASEVRLAGPGASQWGSGSWNPSLYRVSMSNLLYVFTGDRAGSGGTRIKSYDVAETNDVAAITPVGPVFDGIVFSSKTSDALLYYPYGNPTFEFKVADTSGVTNTLLRISNPWTTPGQTNLIELLGQIRLSDDSAVVDYVWTATNVTGAGDWKPVPATTNISVPTNHTGMAATAITSNIPPTTTPLGMFGYIGQVNTNGLVLSGSVNDYTNIFSTLAADKTLTNGFHANLSTGFLTNLVSGYYRITFSVSCWPDVDNNGDEFEMEVFLNEVNQEYIRAYMTGSTGIKNRFNGSGIVYLPANTGISVRLKNEVDASSVLHIVTASFSVGTP